MGSRCQHRRRDSSNSLVASPLLEQLAHPGVRLRLHADDDVVGPNAAGAESCRQRQHPSGGGGRLPFSKKQALLNRCSSLFQTSASVSDMLPLTCGL